ncbi:type IV pilus modification PilV family protein [Legionella sp.]|uniref:type IV pilus modification PilV family protein n=1 Tax=Legionella sp. TaxID=459 RepID=UPI003CA35EAC
MNQQKGFSLVEVLASLLLVTTLALSLVQQQWQSRQLLDQLIIREHASQFLDQIDETLLAGEKKLPPVPSPYYLEIQHHGQETLLHLSWWKNSREITRKLVQG